MTLEGIKYYLSNPNRIHAFLASRGLLNWMSDKMYMKLNYWMKFGKKLELKNPKTFNEKIQWIKLYDRKPIYTVMVDKFSVKEYISDLIGEEYIIPTIGVWDKFEDIDFETLPDQFVLKCTHDSGGLVICRNKEKLNISKIEAKIKKSLKRDFFYANREWPYKDVPHRIIAEQYMEDSSSDGDALPKGLIDYKFFCFNGKPEMIYVSKGLEDHSTAQISFYDLNKKEMPFHRSDFKQIKKAIFPKNFEEMQRIASIIAQNVNCPFVRIDLYSIHEKVYFSEITFSPCSGMLPFEPMEWDYKLGEMITLPIDKKENK